MYNCTTFCAFAVSALVLSTGFTIAPQRLIISQIKPSNCSEKDISVTVKCLLELKKESLSTGRVFNHSSCCSISIYNSSHSSEPCASAEKGEVMSTSAEIKQNRADCLIRITAAQPDSKSYRLRCCNGSNIQLHCEGNPSCGGLIRWRSSDGTLFNATTLLIQNIRKEDGGTYTCESAHSSGKVKGMGLVKVEVQFAPVITVPTSSSFIRKTFKEVLECESEASPRPSITWYQDSTPLAPSLDLYTISSKSRDCRTTTSYISFNNRNISSDNKYRLIENVTCVAENEFGRAVATFLLATFTEESVDTAESGQQRQFNVTGFIVGMIPPLLISFYIIFKLGFRSRYAEERGEEYGFPEEPFFISY